MTTDGSTRTQAPRRKGRGFVAWFFTVVGALVALALVVAGFYVWRVWSTANDVERTDTLLPSGDANRPAATAAVAGSLNYVLMGSDSRGKDQGRSDVLILAHVPPGHGHVYLVSFSRDMWVDIPMRGKAKINAAYAWGGEALATQTVESLVGVRMDHAVKVDFTGFMGLTDELGGVRVDNPVASHSGLQSDGRSYNWPKGPVDLKGQEALDFVRQRYELPGGDFDRAARQRAVVKAILKKILSMDVLANPVRFNDVMGSLGKHFTVDDRLTNEELFKTATGMKVRSDDDIRSLMAPISGLGTSADGQSINIVNEAQMRELAGAIQAGTMDQYWEKYKNQPYGGGR